MFEPSPEIQKNNTPTSKFPWKDLQPGKSWVIQYHEVTLGTLKSMASRYGKKLGRKFKVRDHGKVVGYEVFCSALTQEEIIARNGGAPTIVDALSAMKGNKNEN